MAKKITAEALDAGKLDALKQHIAYKMWEEEGRPEGRSEAHWLAACEVVDTMIANAAELPAWLKRIEQPEEASAETAKPIETIEPATRFQDVARRFARGT